MEQFSKNVILLDTAFLNEVLPGLRNFMSEQLGHALPTLDLPTWLVYLAMDGGVKGKDNEIQVILVADADAKQLTDCTPNQLNDLQGQACRTELGEMLFSVVTPAHITDSGHLFMDLMHITADANEVERLLLVPFDRDYGHELNRDLNKLVEEKEKKGKEKILRFTLRQPTEPMNFAHDFIGYSLMQALV